MHGAGVVVSLFHRGVGKQAAIDAGGRGDKDIDIYRENFPEIDQP